MKREYSPETMNAVLLVRDGNEPRTPLHVPFRPGTSNMVESEQLELRVARLKKSKNLFNAVGSLVMNGSERYPRHLPVLDVDGGAEHSAFVRPNAGTTYKLKLNTNRHWRGHYSPDSNLTELLGDYGMTHEVFEAPRGRRELIRYRDRRERYVVNRDITDFSALDVVAVVLRAKGDIFDTVPSTTKNHSHAFINTEFSHGDHRILLDELTTLGVLAPAWTSLAHVEGMGIVRTPWTDKAPTHNPS